MRILGITDHIISGAAILEDGKVTAAVNEERVVRRKMIMGFPRKSIQKVLELAKIRPDQIDCVAIASKRGHFLNDYVEFDAGTFGISRGLVKDLFMSLGSGLSFLRNDVPILEKLYYELREPAYAHRRNMIKKVLRDEFDVAAPVEFVEHHFAHACSAFYSSGYRDSLVATMDASGDGSSSHIYHVKNGRWQLLHRVASFDSLASYYAYVTHICGFKAGKHEGKITGLAAYGKDAYRDIFEKLICFRDGTVVNSGRLFYRSALKKIRDALLLDFSKKDLAATIQLMSEEIAANYIRHWSQKTGEHNVSLAGGLFANVKINQRVHEVPGVKSLFIHPAMSDEGLAVGASLALNYMKSPEPAALSTRCFDHVYLGPDYSDSEIHKLLGAEGVKYEQHSRIEDRIARLIADGYVVARFAGKMEYGPRALGNRSILYRPDDSSVNDWLNKNLKRTEFMPFAPSTLAEDADHYFTGLDGARETARYMTITFNCTEQMRKECPGVVHVDYTARPQLVSEQDNPSYYRIIRAFRKLTGHSSIINTSFNIHEEPIVCTPEDALRAFKIGHLDYLALGSFIAEHPQLQSREREPVRNISV